MSNKFLFFLFALFGLYACNQGGSKQTKEQEIITQDSLVAVNLSADSIDNAINSFVDAYIKKDSKAANALIHPDLGISIIFRPGASDLYYHVDSIDFSRPVPEYYPYFDVKKDFELAYDKLPEFDCGTDKWNKQGFYCDTTLTPKQLSEIVEFEKEFQPANFPSSYVQKIADLEKDSYRVILTSENPLIFHVKKYKGKWYVTVLDRAYAGCDA